MAISYNKLWKLLIDKGIKKMELRKRTGMSNSTLAKLGKNKAVALSVIEKICAALDCQPGDIMEYVPDAEDGGELSGGQSVKGAIPDTAFDFDAFDFDLDLLGHENSCDPPGKRRNPKE